MEPTPAPQPHGACAEVVSARLSCFQLVFERGDFRQVTEIMKKNVIQPDPALENFLAQNRFDLRVDPVALGVFLVGGLVWVGIAAASLFH